MVIFLSNDEFIASETESLQGSFSFLFLVKKIVQLR